jgi:solute carrier family 25 iron transporter 28/37
MECIKQVYRTEGFGAFYRSYTTQLTMNVPFQCIHFMSYELMQNYTNKDRYYNPAAHMVSGAVAGAIAAAATTPLDVCKTLLNTQEAAVSGLVAAAKTVYHLKGMSGYFRGLKARVLYQMPSTAICWSTYEFFKYIMHNRRIVDTELLLPTVETDAIRPWEDLSLAPISSQSTVTSSPSSQMPTINTSPATAGLYGALAFNTVHHHHDSSLHNSALLDVSPMSRS